MSEPRYNNKIEPTKNSKFSVVRFHQHDEGPLSYCTKCAWVGNEKEKYTKHTGCSDESKHCPKCHGVEFSPVRGDMVGKPFERPVNLDELIKHVLDLESNENRWRNECVIITNYKAPYCDEKDKPKLVIYHPPSECFVRYSHGPHQCYFWDMYGDDMHSIECAIVALSHCQRPWGKPYVEFKIPLKTPEPAKA